MHFSSLHNCKINVVAIAMYGSYKNMKTLSSSKPHIICYRGFPRDFLRVFLTITVRKKQ